MRDLLKSGGAAVDGYRLLATTIVNEGIEEFKRLTRRVPKRSLCLEAVWYRKRELNKLMRFFKSPWCGALLPENVNQGAFVREMLNMYRNSKFLAQATEFEKKQKD